MAAAEALRRTALHGRGALRGVAAAAAPSMLDGKLGQVTFRIFSTLLFLNTATTNFSGQFQLLKLLAGPAEHKKDRLGFLPNQYLTIFFCSLEVLVIFHLKSFGVSIFFSS